MIKGQVEGFSPYLQAAALLPPHIYDWLAGVDTVQQKRVTEIRLFANRPIVLFENKTPFFLRKDSTCQNTPDKNCLRLSQAEVETSFRALCGYSVHNHQEEIKNGFLSLPGGHRAGFCGTAVYQNGQLSSFRSISSINLRIAHVAFGCAEGLYQAVLAEEPANLVLVGPPASGKTTLLRDLIRILSGFQGGFRPVAVVDERGELGTGEPDAVCHTILGLSKATAILQAVRTLAPEWVVCDELGTSAEVAALQSGFNSGVHFITTVHASSRQELLRKEQIRVLLQNGSIDVVAFLGKKLPGCVEEIWRIKNNDVQSNGTYFDYCFRSSSRGEQSNSATPVSI